MAARARARDPPPWPRSRMSVIVWAMAPTLTFGPCVSLEVKRTYRRGKPVDFPVDYDDGAPDQVLWQTT